MAWGRGKEIGVFLAEDICASFAQESLEGVVGCLVKLIPVFEDDRVGQVFEERPEESYLIAWIVLRTAAEPAWTCRSDEPRQTPARQ